MKKKVLKGLFFVLLGYVVLVAIHFLYLEMGGRAGGNWGVMRERRSLQLFASSGESADQSAVRNYASLKVQMPMPNDAVKGSQMTLEQKYEKIASLNATTSQFREDEKQTRSVIKAHNALVQEEAVNSNDGTNVLSLTIGVPPEEFDPTVADLKKIGKIQDSNVTKTDKTNDFLRLKAKRITLEKARDSLISLKTLGGKIEELVKVEQEILSLEGKIQDLGVQLGQFDKVNEFCTVRFKLAEIRTEAVPSPHLGYLLEAMQWATTIYLAWLGILCVGLVGVVLLLVIIEKSKIFRNES